MKIRGISLVGVIIVLLAVLTGVLFFFRHRPSAPPEVELVPPLQETGPCPGETKTFTMSDVYMRGILEKGSTFKVVTGFYRCNPLKHDDLVFYRLSSQMPPVVKIVKGIPGDHFKVTKSKKTPGWNLYINKEMVMTGTTPYFFGGDAPPTLSLYIDARNGILRQGETILLSSWPPGDSDSGTLGLVSIKDIIGKVDIEK